MKTKNMLIFIVSLLITNTMNAQTDVKVEIKDMQEMHMVYYEFTGAYDQSFNDFPKLMGYIQANKLPMGPHSLGIFYDDPQEVPAEKLRSEIGFLVTKPVETSGDYKYKKIKAGKAVVARYTSMEDIMPVYAAIGKYIAENNLKTRPYSIEVYYSYDENSIDAEVLMPLAE